MFKRIQNWILVGICILSLLSISATHAGYGENEGTMRGMVFLDRNKNGKLDDGEKGIGWVYFTIRSGDYSHTYYSEWREKDEAGNLYATGTFGPAPLPSGNWEVTFHVPKGYVATTPVQQNVFVPGKAGGHVGYVYMGLYSTSSGNVDVLPKGGMLERDPVMPVGLLVLGVGILVSTGLGLVLRRRS